MATLPESAVYEDGIFQLEITTPPLGGEILFNGDNPIRGHANVQAFQLGNRTAYLKEMVDSLDERLTDVISVSAGIFPDTATGLAATAEGNYFSVPSTNPNEYLILYRKVSGAAVEISRSPNTHKVDQIDGELYRTKNQITGGGDLVLDSQSGQSITSLALKNSAASVWLVGTDEKLIVDTLSNKLNVSMDLVTNVNILNATEGHSDKTDFPEFQTLADSATALILGNKKGDVAFQIDTVKNKIQTSFSFESSVETRPPTIFVDVPPRIERNTSDPFYRLSGRVYQATATIERTGPTRYWSAWRADNTNAAEVPGNFTVLAYSDDNNVTVKEYGYLTYSPSHPDKHMVDPMLWLDPEGRLWLFYGVMGNNLGFDGVQGTWASICQNPNAEFPVWGQGFRLSYFADPRHPVQVNGKWYIALDGWRHSAEFPPRYMEHVGGSIYHLDWQNQKLEFVSRLPPNNGAQYSGFFETEFAQRSDGSVIATCRSLSASVENLYCISNDLMQTWSPWSNYTAISPSSSSRMWLGRTPSGRMLLCWNNDTIRRTLTVGLSDDDGTTYPYKVVLEPGSTGQVSYPVVTFGDNGEIFIIYDNQRTGPKKQIRIAKIIEQQVVAGTSVPVVNIVSDPANP